MQKSCNTLVLLMLASFLSSNSRASEIIVSAEFALLDQDHDGLLSYPEAIGDAKGKKAAQRHWQFYDLDLNNDDQLTEAEYIAAATQRTFPAGRDFARHDVDRSGDLTLKEFQQRRNESAYPLLARNFKVVDFDGDEKLSLGEFATLAGLESPQPDRGNVPDPITELCIKEFTAWKEMNAASGMSKEAWPRLKWAGPSTSLSQISFDEWDRNHDGIVSDHEAEFIFKQAFNLTTTTGDIIRRPNGTSLDVRKIRKLDQDANGILSQKEFVSAFSPATDKNSEVFAARDLDGDGQLTYTEAGEIPELQVNVVTRYLWWDANADGGVDDADLRSRAIAQHQQMVPYVIVAFDADRDHRLSFAEFRSTPLLETSGDWYRSRDINNDGVIDWQEFYLEKGPFSVGLARYFFDRFDRDDNGVLSENEFTIQSEPKKVDATARFKSLDRNKDGQIAFEELFAPLSGDADEAAATRYERARLLNKTWFDSADGNKDGHLSAEEFRERFSMWTPDVYELFVSLDSDGDDQLTAEEYSRPALGTRRDPTVKGQAALFDLNDDGFLSLKEFSISPRANPTLEQLFVGLDVNFDGNLSMDEFIHTYAEDQRRGGRRKFFQIDLDGNGVASREEWQKQGKGQKSATNPFRIRDTDGNGSLTLEEFLGPIDAKRKAYASRNFKVVDFDGDGQLSLEEFRCLPGAGRMEERGEIDDPIVDLMEVQLKRVRDVLRQQDTDGDERLNLREWPILQINEISRDLGAISPSLWDRNRDGYVVPSECRAVLEQCYGVRRLDGALMRLPTGHVLNVATFLRLDADKDGTLSKTEFVSRFRKDSQENQEIFTRRDQNNDEKLDWNELLACPEMMVDTLSQFFRYDINLDGVIDRQELVELPEPDERMSARQKRLGSRTMPAFSSDGERLTFREFRVTPFANPIADWFRLRNDVDHDGKLSWSEFYTEPPPLNVCLYREYFNRFDQDHDGTLTFDELEFSVDLDKLTVEIAFRIQDLNRDGKLVLSEFFAEPKPPASDVAATERYEMRLAAAETRFISSDLDHDGALSFDELKQSKEEALRAVEWKTKALTRKKTSATGNVPFIAIVILDIQIVLGVAWYLWKRRQSRNAS